MANDPYETVRKIATLEANYAAVVARMGKMEDECKEANEELREEIAGLKEILADYRKYGWFVMGAIGFGMLLTMGYEKAREKLLGLLFG